MLTSSTTAGARHSSSKLGSALAVAALQRCSVAVLEKLFPHPKNTSIFIYIYIYINIELIFDFHTTYFGTATLQQLQQISWITGNCLFCSKDLEHLLQPEGMECGVQ